MKIMLFILSLAQYLPLLIENIIFSDKVTVMGKNELNLTKFTHSPDTTVILKVSVILFSVPTH